MAVTNKDFKIKHGLIVEGATGTINGADILTKNTDSDNYIIDLIGGQTLITSVDADQLEVVSGELSVKSGVFDAAGSADAAETAANSYTDGRETAITSAYQSYADTAETDAISAAATYTDGRETAITAAYESYADTAEADARSYADSLATNYDAAGAAATAEQNAKDYADDLINDASSSSSEVWSAYKTSTEIGLAQAAAEQHADDAVAALVGSAPELLDTLQELASALDNDPETINTLQGIAAGKQDALDPGNGIVIDGDNVIYIPTSLGSGISITPSEVEIDRTTVDTWYDSNGAAAAAQTAAETFATNAINALDTDDIEEGSSNLYFTNQRAIDAVGGTIGDAIDELNTDDIEEGANNQYFSDVRAKTSAAALITGATKTNIVITGDENGLTITAENGVADSNTDDLAEGEENLYFTDERAIDAVSAADIYPNAVIINNLTKQVANQVTVTTAGIATGISWAKAEYRSAEFVVKVAYGDHTEISKVLLTLDVNDNIAITEYGNVTTNGSASSISADISGTDARLRVTTVNNNSTVTVLGTLIA